MARVAEDEMFVTRWRPHKSNQFSKSALPRAPLKTPHLFLAISVTLGDRVWPLHLFEWPPVVWERLENWRAVKNGFLHDSLDSERNVK